MKEFECRGQFGQFTDVQKYEMNRKSVTSKIGIVAPTYIDVIPSSERKAGYNLLVQKNQPINLTCVALVGCNDINYDIHFVTNATTVCLSQIRLFVILGRILFSFIFFYS